MTMPLTPPNRLRVAETLVVERAGEWYTEFDGDKAYVCFPDGLRIGSDSPAFQNTMERLSLAARVHTHLARYAVHHPSRFGLVHSKVPVDVLLRFDGYTLPRLDHGLLGVRGELFADFTVDAADLAGDTVWTGPHCNLAVFGTWYLTPVTWRAGDPQAPVQQVEGWALRQAGIPGVAEFAPWNDAAHIETLCRRIETEDPETALTVRALADAVTVAQATARHRRVEGVNAAESSFAAGKVFDRASVGAAITQAAKSVRPDVDLNELGACVNRVYHDVSEMRAYLADRPVTVSALQGYRPKGRTVHVVECRVVPEKLPVQPFVDACREHVGCDVFVVGNTVWLTLNAAALQEHRALFGIAQDLQ